jgi:phosphoglycolate phosphatase
MEAATPAAPLAMALGPLSPRVALFDLDGTLIDSLPDITVAVAELLATENLAPLEESQVRAMVGHGLKPLVERAFAARERILTEEELHAMLARMAEIYPRHLTGRTRLMPGVLDCLDRLSAAGCAVALVTNKRHTAATRILEHFGLLDRFSIVTGEHERPTGLSPKPSADMLLFTLARLDVSPRDAIMVGDSSADIMSGRAARVFSIGVRNGYSVQPLETFEPDAIIDTLVDLPSALAAWRQRA